MGVGVGNKNKRNGIEMGCIPEYMEGKVKSSII